MLMLLITYIVLNLFVLRKKSGKNGVNIDGADGEMSEKEALIKEKIERFTYRLNSIIFTILKGVAWLLSAALVVAIILLFIAIFFTIFDPQQLGSMTIFGINLLPQAAYQFGLKTVLYGLIISVIPLICIVYLTITLLLKRKPIKWLIFSTLALWITLIIYAILSDNFLNFL